MITKIVSLKDYLELTKPGVQALLFISCVSGMLLASNFKPPLGVLFYGVLGISLLAASSAVINHIFDVFIDSKMSRTSSRPIVTGVISTKEASLFALLLFLTGSLLLFFYTNTLTLLLTSFTFIFYAFIYTKYLKFLTSQNIVIGGLAGAMPPLLGWVAVTNSMDPNAWLLVLIVVVWTPPHFWALAIHRVEDYRHAKIPMLPVQRGVRFTKLYILLYTILLLVATALPFAVQMFGLIYLLSAFVLGGIFLYYSIKLYLEETNYLAMKTFNYSILYLAMLFCSMLLDRYLSL